MPYFLAESQRRISGMNSESICVEFIHCKADGKEITNFNISVGITEAFMSAAESGEDYDLLDPSTNKSVGRLNARAVCDEIVAAAWQNGSRRISPVRCLKSPFRRLSAAR